MAVHFYETKELLPRLIRQNPPRPHVFLVGSALTMPANGMVGVPSVAGVVDLVRAHYRTTFEPEILADLEQQLTTAASQYQAAFKHLNGLSSVEEANRIIRRAVLQAYQGAELPSVANQAACEAAERDVASWSLPPWVEALGILITAAQQQHPPSRFAPMVLTTNFDPLVQVAVTKAGGHYHMSVFDRDGNLAQVHGHGCHVVHLHGHWLVGDSLHSEIQLGCPRPHLRESLRRLIEDKAVVVLGYGGWDDIFTSALADVLGSAQGRTEVLWAFFESDEVAIAQKNARLLSMLQPGHDRHHVALYKGVDLRTFLPALLSRVTTNAGSPRPSLGLAPSMPGVECSNSSSEGILTASGATAHERAIQEKPIHEGREKQHQVSQVSTSLSLRRSPEELDKIKNQWVKILHRKQLCAAQQPLRELAVLLAEVAHAVREMVGHSAQYGVSVSIQQLRINHKEIIDAYFDKQSKLEEFLNGPRDQVVDFFIGSVLRNAAYAHHQIILSKEPLPRIKAVSHSNEISEQLVNAGVITFFTGPNDEVFLANYMSVIQGALVDQALRICWHEGLAYIARCSQWNPVTKEFFIRREQHKESLIIYYRELSRRTKTEALTIPESFDYRAHFDLAKLTLQSKNLSELSAALKALSQCASDLSRDIVRIIANEQEEGMEVGIGDQ